MQVAAEHKKAATKEIKFAFVTVSTSRYRAMRKGESPDDLSFKVAKEVIESSGHLVTRYALVPDEPRLLLEAVSELLESSDVDAVVLSGGTGPTPDDVTVETLRPLFDKELDGFGEVFRVLSLREAGSSSFLSNATAGIVGGKVVFCLPGSPNAVELALRELVIPEAGHILSLARRGLQ